MIDQQAMLQQWLMEIANTVYPRSWVELEALEHFIGDDPNKQLIYLGGLGNPLRRDFHPFANEVQDAVARVLRGNWYGKEGGMSQLINAARWYYEEVDKIVLDPSQLMVNEMGSCQLLGYLAEAMVDKTNHLVKGANSNMFIDEKGDLHALIVGPAYGRHLSALPRRDVRWHVVNLWGLGMPFGQALRKTIIRSIEKRAPIKLVALSSAYNPTTRVMTLEELREAVAICKEFGIVLFLDGAYRQMYREIHGMIPSVFAVDRAMDGWVVETLTASKGWQSPGCGGVLIGNTDIVKLVADVRKRKGEGGYIPTQMKFAALLYDLQYVKENRKMYDEFLSYLVSTWTSAGWPLTLSPATIFLEAELPPALREAGYNANNCARLFARNGIIVYPASYFPGYTSERIRICANGTKDDVEKGAEIIRNFTQDPPPLPATWPEDMAA